MKKDIKSLANQKLQGQVGENAVWDGPLSKEGFDIFFHYLVFLIFPSFTV